MAYPVSTTFRNNCYDPTKKQRLVLASTDGTVVFTNEDIVVSQKVKFNLASCKSQQITFGELPCNTISLSLFNENGYITSSDLAKEYNCYMGVEISIGAYLVGQNAIAMGSNGNERISIHSVAPYIRGNIKLGTTISQLSNGYPCKIYFAYDNLYFVVQNGNNRYYGKHVRSAAFTFGNNQTPSNREKAFLDKLMNNDKLTGLSLFNTRFIEYGVPTSTSITTTTWQTVKNSTWDTIKSSTWGALSGYTNFPSRTFEVVPYGVWHFNKPRRIKDSLLTLNGRDRMNSFDEDSGAFTKSSVGKYYYMAQIIQSIADAKNVPVGTILNFVNDFFAINQIYKMTYFEGKSYKDLLSYAFEVCATNGIIDRNGSLSAISNDTTAYALPHVYSFDVADSVAHTIGSALVYKQGDYALYQTDGNISNGATYDWSDNPFFTNSNPTGSWFSNNNHTKYGGFHNAITVADADYSLWCDDSYTWTVDGTTYREPIFAMSVEWDGFGRVTYTNYGEEARTYASYNSRMNAVTSVNDVNIQGLNKAQRANKLEFDNNGLNVYSQGLRILNATDEVVFDADENGNLRIKGQIEATSGDIGRWQISESGLYCEKLYDNWGLEIYAEGLHFRTDENYELSYIIHRERENSRSIEIMCNYDNTSDSNILLTANNIVLQDNIVTIWGDVYFQQSNALFQVKANDVRFDNSIQIKTVPTTATAANTTLVSGTNGYKIHLVSSLRAVKDNIKTIENPSEKVDNLRGVSFTSKCDADDPKTVMFGFIAEEVAEAVPELAAYVDGKLQSVQYDRVCALLVEDNKALHKRISDLESRLEELERRLNK